MKLNEKTYIGDGVFASFDGYQFWLETERSADGLIYGETVVHQIALDNRTWAALCNYVAQTQDHFASQAVTEDPSK